MPKTLIHLDSDLGGDMDDLCALAYLLRHPQAELTAVTTSAEENGRRAGFTRRALELAGRAEIPVAAGGDVALGRFRWKPGYPPDERYWPAPVPPAPGPLAKALDLLRQSLETGATIVVVGPFTNLYLLEQAYPGSLARARVVLMGGWTGLPRPGFPQWGPEDDYNVQMDIEAARFVLERCPRVDLVPLTVTVETALRRAHLPALRGAGPLGELIAFQAEAFAREYQNEETYGGGLINFQHDPLACAAALGWPGLTFEALPLALEVQDGFLRAYFQPGGMPVRVATAVDGEAFNRHWLEIVSGQQQAGQAVT